MRNLRSLAAAVGIAAVLAGCTDQPTAPLVEPPDAGPPAAVQLDPIFAAAGEEFGVPASLLKAIGYAETRWEMVKGEVEFEGVPPAFGVMALRGEQLERGAALAGVSAEAVRTRPEANIRAAAALLGAYAAELEIGGQDLAAWAPAVVRYSGISAPEYQALYVHQGVYSTLREGAESEGPYSASLAPVEVRPEFLEEELSTLSSSMACAPDYCFSGTVWRPSPDYNSRPSGDIGKVHMVIIHTCEGGYSSCINTLINSTRSVSAHYVINESGSEVSQLVREASRAWHIGATYYCSNNGGHECWRDGYSSNHFTIGIEHAGYASQSSFPVGQVDKSAHLSCDISKAYGIPRDRFHYVAHGQLQSNRSDPGPNWPWTDYMNRINNYCGAAKTYGADLQVRWANGKELVSAGNSGAIADWHRGDLLMANLTIKNTGNQDFPNTQIGYYIQGPFFHARSYTIYTDWPYKDGKTWTVNDADSHPNNPPKDALGTKGKLHLYKLSPGETKRIVFHLTAAQYSIGRTDHPDVRGWLWHVDGIYGEQDDFFASPTNGNKIGYNVRHFAQADLFARDEWQFNTGSEPNTEGWTGGGTHDQFKVNASVGSLSVHSTGNDVQTISPTWTRVTADGYDQMVIRVRSHDGRHRKAIYWARSGEGFSESRVVRFYANGDSNWQTIVVPVDKHAYWSGTVVRLRVDPLDGAAPASGQSGWYDIDRVFFQNSSTRKTSSHTESYVTLTPVPLL